MLIGAHVSPAGGLPNAVANGVERECDAIQIFNQSPRAWKPTAHSEESIAEFRSAMADSRIEAVVIHAVYLINTATEDAELTEKSRLALEGALTLGAAIGATGVVLHAGSALKGDVGQAIARAGRVIREALDNTEGCDLHLENTAGAGGTLGRSFTELAGLIDAAGGGERIGFCLDSCHLLASGYDVRTPESVADVLAAFDEEVGLDRLRSLHVNDSMTPLGSNRDRHAPIGEGEIGRAGCAAFLSAPEFDGLPTIFEGPGMEGKGASIKDIRLMKRLRNQGLKARDAA